MFPLYDRNPTRGKPFVTRALIFANVAVFFLGHWLDAQGIHWIAQAYGMVPARLNADPEGETVKIFSSLFLHADFMHLAWNMLFLHIFGDNVEDALGKARYILLYALAGVAGGLAQFASDPTSAIPLIGASGAIAGILGGYLVLYPRAPITIFNVFILPLPILVLPAWFVVGWWFAVNLFGSLANLGGASSSVAYLAHLGGFVLGLILTRSLLRDETEARGEWSGFRPPPRVPQRKIFPRQEQGPFWRDQT